MIMMRLLLVALAFFILPVLSSTVAFAGGDNLEGRVISVHDGDTITILDATKHQTKIRLAEIDAPELDQPYGNKSKQMLSDLVFGKDVTVKVQTIDKYGRTVGRIYQSDTDANLTMVKQGGAWAYRKYLTDDTILAAEESAKAAGAGLWGLQDDQRVPPWEWRHGGKQAQDAPSTSVETAPVDQKSIVTLDQFKDALPVNAEELHLQDFLDLKKHGPVVVIDVRAEGAYVRRHLTGSVNMPLTDLTEKTLPQIVPDKNMPVVLACDYSFQPVRMIAMTIQAYPVLKANGYTKIYRLNLWNSPSGQMVSDEAQEKALAFEGTEVKLAPAPEPAAVFSCGGKSTCGQMANCAEARFYLTECGLKKLDRDGDGTPCESLCR